ncbi:hypothetical protein CK203_082163 [Vitis vinifera]|uniref:Uncharacterized protein n=1 Tax=Vitis vinifera TaxID=29760 RepID=A0A438CMN9_VITVI|nr:hypothetical protein CK203_082163 [Vitis vinifera]
MHSPPLSKAAMPNSGALGYPSEPQLERKRICPPPAAPASSQPSTSAEPRMAIPILNTEELSSLETSQHLRAVLLKRWQPLEHAKSRCWPLRLNTLPS